MTKRMLIIGSSRGIGAEMAKYFSNSKYKVIGVSRSPSKDCEWIKADVATVEGRRALFAKIGDLPIDVLIFSSGVWEEHGFMADFDFRKTGELETSHIMSVNLVAPIEITKGIANNLSQAENPRAIYLGALSGNDQSASSQVAYSASKFGLRGAIQALRLALNEEEIGFTVINPGNVGTEEVLLDIQEGRMSEQTPIPVQDLISATEWVLSLSSGVEVGDINIMQKNK